MPFRRHLNASSGRIQFELNYDGQPVLNDQNARDNLGLIGTAQEVNACSAQLLQQADQQALPIFLLGTQDDDDLLDLPETLQLNLVRCILLPTLQPGTNPATLRANLEEISKHVKVHFPVQNVPVLLFTGRHLAQHSLFLLGRVPQLRAQGITLVSDISAMLRTPIPASFRRFIVWPSEHARYDRAVERWHRHDITQSGQTQFGQSQAGHRLLWREEDGPSCYVIE